MSEENHDQNQEHISLPSFSSAGVVVLCIIIFFLGPIIGKTGSLILFGALCCVIFWQAFSPGQYEKMKQTYPDMERSFWILNNLVYHLLIPVVLLVIGYGFLRFLR